MSATAKTGKPPSLRLNAGCRSRAKVSVEGARPCRDWHAYLRLRFGFKSLSMQARRQAMRRSSESQVRHVLACRRSCAAGKGHAQNRARGRLEQAAEAVVRFDRRWFEELILARGFPSQPTHKNFLA